MAITQDQQFTNNATTTVPSTISNVATSITVSTGTGALFPTLAGAQFAVCTIVNTISSDPGYGQLEIVKVTARSGDVFTIVRGQESTSAKSFPAGCVFELRPTAGGINEVYNKMIAGDALQAPLASPTFTGDPKAPTPTLGDNDTSIATTGYVQTAFNTYGDRHVNMIINPHGSVQQEGAITATANAVYLCDQWLTGFTAATAAFQASVTNGGVSSYDPSNMFIKTTTAKASLAAGDYLLIAQPLEGVQVRRLLYGTANARGSWLRWRASASQNATCTVSVSNGANNRSFCQTFAVTTTPTDYSLFIPGDTTGTWPVDVAKAASIVFCHSAGTTFQTSTLGAWQSGQFFAATTQTNLLGTLNAQLNITDVQWNDAPILLPFQTIDYQAELDRCQRYFVTLPALGASSPFGVGHAVSTTQGFYTIPFPQPVRTSITVTISAAADFQLTNASGGSTVATSFAALGGNTTCANVAFNIGSASLATGNGSLLIAANANAKIFISSRM